MLSVREIQLLLCPDGASDRLHHIRDDVFGNDFIEHAPLVQVPPMPHCMQVLPPEPQAKRFWVELGTQTPLRQQPLGHVIGLHC